MSTSSVVGPRSSEKDNFPKLNLHQKQVMVTAWWAAAGLTQYSFLNAGCTMTSEKQAQRIERMHRKPCLRPHWSADRVSRGHRCEEGTGALQGKLWASRASASKIGLGLTLPTNCEAWSSYLIKDRFHWAPVRLD